MTAFLDSATVAGVRASTTGLFWDECVILRRTAPASTSGYGKEEEKFGNYDGAHASLAITTTCKVGMDDGDEIPDQTQRPERRATILFPSTIEGSVSELDRVQITKRFGTSLARTLLCDVIGIPAMVVTGLLAEIRLRPGGAGNG